MTLLLNTSDSLEPHRKSVSPNSQNEMLNETLIKSQLKSVLKGNLVKSENLSTLATPFEPKMESNHLEKQTSEKPFVAGTTWKKKEEVVATYGETQFRQRYQRNNKRGGLKNLRCFPMCAEVHKERGFCGRSVICIVKHPKLDRNPSELPTGAGNGNKVAPKKPESAAKMKKRLIEITDNHKYMCRAEFVKVGESGLVNLGDVITRDFMAAQDRSKAEPTKPWVEGELVLDRSTKEESVFEFNKDRKGWHYGWASNKHTCNAKHCLLTYVFERIPGKDNEFRCIDAVRSTPFMLYCRRRRRFVSVPSAPISPPLKRSLPTSGNSAFPDKKQRKCYNQDYVMKSTQKVSFDVSETLFLKGDPLNVMPHTKDSESQVLQTDSKSLIKAPQFEESKSKNQKQELKRSSIVPICQKKPKLKISRAASRLKSGVKKRTNLNRELSSPRLDITQLDAILSGVAEAISKVRDQKILSKLEPIDDDIDEWPTSAKSDNESHELRFDSTDQTFLGDVLNEGPLSSDLFMDASREDLEDFSKSIGDCIDFFSDLPNLELNLIDPIFDSDEEDLIKVKQTSKRDNEKIIEDLSQYLLYEKGFTESIHKLTGNKSGASYQGFLDVLQANLEGFMKKHKLTVEEFDRIFGINQSSKERKPQGFFGNICEAFVTLISPVPAPPAKKVKIPKYIDGPNNKRIANHSGRWKRNHSSSEEMMSLRSMVGIPWLLGKMFDYMESQFEIQQNGLEMSCRLRRKLLSNGCVKMILDGIERPFGLKLPILSSLSRNWTCRAFCSGDTVTCIHTFDTRRLTRVSWLSPDESVLYSRVTLETYDELSDTWMQRKQVQQTADRED